jgi:hypothetical protein
MTSTEDERPVQALGPDGAHPSLGGGVGPRSPERGEDDLDAVARKDRIEAPRVLGVPIPEEEAKTARIRTGPGRGSEPAG